MEERCQVFCIIRVHVSKKSISFIVCSVFAFVGKDISSVEFEPRKLRE